MLLEANHKNRMTFLALWILVFSVPFENMVVIEGIGTINRFVGIICVCLAVFAMLRNGSFRTPGAVLVLFLVFVLWSMTTFFWTIDHEQSRIAIITAVQLLGFVWLVWEFAATEREQSALLSAYVLGAYVSVASILYHYIQGVQSSWFRYSAVGFDPNDIGLTMALGVPIAWWLAMTVKHKSLAVIYYLYLPAAFFAITLTASRAAFLAFAVAVLYVAWTFLRSHLLSKLASIVMLLAMVLSLAYLVPDYSIDRLSTITSSLASGRLNTREYIWSSGLSVFAENPLLGVGIGGFSEGVEQFRIGGFAPHNLFLSILVDQGIIGLLLFFAVLCAAAVQIIWMPTMQARMWIVLLLVWFVGVMALGWAYSKPTWFIIALLAVQGASAAERANYTDQRSALASGVTEPLRRWD